MEDDSSITVEDVTGRRTEDPSEQFSDEETEAGRSTINYDDIGMDSSRGSGTRDSPAMKRMVTEDKPMKKISNTARWKVFVIILMLVNTSAVIIATSVYLNHESDREFERAFDSAAKTVSDAAHYHAEALADSLEVLSDAVTAYSHDAGATWPYVTLPRFEQRIAPIRESGGMWDLAGFLPYVKTVQREYWETYAVQEQGWIQESYRAQAIDGLEVDVNTDLETERASQLENGQRNNVSAPLEYSISEQISISVKGEYVVNQRKGPYAPIWQLSPPPPPAETGIVNTDLMSGPTFQALFESLVSGDSTTGFAISHVLPLSLYTTTTDTSHQNNTHSSPSEQSKSVLFRAIRGSYSRHGDVGGFAIGVFDWEQFFSNLLPEDINGLDCVLHNPCDGRSQTFRIQGRGATYLGDSDIYEGRHDTAYQTNLTEFTSHAYAFDVEGSQDVPGKETSACHYEIYIHPAPEFYSDMESNGPAIFTAVIASVFIGTGLIFLVYVYLIGNRQNKVMAIAMSTSAIVSSLFPSTVRDRIMNDAHEEVKLRMSNNRSSNRSTHSSVTPSRGMMGGRRMSMRKLSEHRQGTQPQRSKPIADLFPEATVLFADIVGFTAWSSVREPTQVFELLETIYHSFDEIAKRRRVFKVETIGDCYVAVTGLPNPNKEHAVNMCRFARDSLHVMGMLTKKLEVSLGPDTCDLSMRFGLHSGPVTAGVLRGERSRFQLFGDTVNTAARMESNGAPEKIHISEQTAEKLREAGKEEWFVPREDKIIAKGKGELQTFWLHTKKSVSGKSLSGDSIDDSINLDDWMDLPAELFDSQRSKMGLGNNEIRQCLSEQNQRLADWNSNQLLLLLANVVSRRNASVGEFAHEDDTQEGNQDALLGNAHIGFGDTGSILDETTDRIAMPEYDAEAFADDTEHNQSNLDELVQQQLRDYVSIICSMYVDNPFHSYQHASHVTMSIIKLLSSISAPKESNFKNPDTLRQSRSSRIREKKGEGERFHSKTYGISSDPIAHFALAFAALIHDVDHPGVSNKTLVKEKGRLARIFNNQCVAEQNSFQCAWDLLMDPSFDYLRGAIYTTNEEFQHFRQLVVNTIIATDLLDKDLNDKREKRWELAFSTDVNEEAAPEASIDGQKELQDRQATVLLEYLVQASDVAHTMQHWTVYRKWNERLFYENVKAFNAGRLEEDPCNFWYEAELEFFDNTIIPLAKKLKASGAFGIYFDESLNYAVQNRHAWERQGKDIVSEMEQAFEALGKGDFSPHRESALDDSEENIHRLQNDH